MGSSLSIVYVLTNSAMPGLVKIGYTSQDDANSRIAQLYTTGVPVPFTIEYACKVQNAEEVEKALHIAFGLNRINPKREFFRIEPDQAIAILKLLHTEEATQEVTDQPSMIDQQSIAAAEQLRARRPNLNFEEMGIARIAAANDPLLLRSIGGQNISRLSTPLPRAIMLTFQCPSLHTLQATKKQNKEPDNFPSSCRYRIEESKG